MKPYNLARCKEIVAPTFLFSTTHLRVHKAHSFYALFLLLFREAENILQISTVMLSTSCKFFKYGICQGNSGSKKVNVEDF